MQASPATERSAAAAGYQERAELLERLARRALVYCTHMIWEANHRPDREPGDPKVGGHPAACASSLHLAAALHLSARHPSDYTCAKPHLAPLDHALNYMTGFLRRPDGSWMEREEMEAAMHRLRAFPQRGEAVFQSYHAESEPDSWRVLPSGSVGIPPVVTAYLALAYDYAADHGYAIKGKKHFWSVIGDSEFREGSLQEALPDIAERELGNVTWIVDYNRQNLDGTRIPNPRGLRGTDADRIEHTARANGWEVIQLRHGRRREELFRRPGGGELRDFLEGGLNDYEVQALLWKRDAKLLRQEILERRPELRRFLKEVDDAELLQSFADLGGHDMARVLEALAQARRNLKVPSLIVAHTVKGWGLRCYAAPGNHSAIPDDAEIRELLSSEGLAPERPYELAAGEWAPGGPEIAFLEARGAELRAGVAGSLQRMAENRERVRKALEPTLPSPEDFSLNVDLVPLAHTQWAWGQIAGKLVRVSTRDELARAGREAGKELTAEEARWAAAADLLLTMSPDVGTSTNIHPAMDQKVYGPEVGENVEAELDFHDRGRPELFMHPDPWTRHIRFEIAEANCMSALGAFGKMGALTPTSHEVRASSAGARRRRAAASSPTRTSQGLPGTQAWRRPSAVGAPSQTSKLRSPAPQRRTSRGKPYSGPGSLPSATRAATSCGRRVSNARRKASASCARAGRSSGATMRQPESEKLVEGAGAASRTSRHDSPPSWSWRWIQRTSRAWTEGRSRGASQSAGSAGGGRNVAARTTSSRSARRT